MYYGAIEAGGTKFVCAVSDADLNIINRMVIPTTVPSETMEQVYQFFDGFSLRSIGIGSFGPIDVNPSSQTFGYITTTPKKAWASFDLRGALVNKYHVPVQFTTDVNAAAYGEYKMGSGKGYRSCLYLTIGTGVGGGAVVDGKILEGYSHPEMGHLLINKHNDDTYGGNCPYHGSCLEGLVSGPAIEGRYGVASRSLANQTEVWELVAHYISQALVNYTLVLRPEKIILGGGVMKQRQLFPLIHDEFTRLLNGYVETPRIDQFIVPPHLEDNAGITGCLLLAIEAAAENSFNVG